MKFFKLLIVAILVMIAYGKSQACSRVVYIGDKNYVLVGRTQIGRAHV